MGALFVNGLERGYERAVDVADRLLRPRELLLGAELGDLDVARRALQERERHAADLKCAR